jgi:DNA recombination protein RmuC
MSETALIAILCLVAGLAAGGLIVFLMRPRAAQADRAAEQNLAHINTRLDDMGKWLQGAHGQLQKSVNERLDAVSQNLGVSVQTAAKHTTDNLQKLNERLAVIDTAQKNITELATQVSSLQGVLSNKQSRGAFGQGQLEAIVADLLPRSAYEFQYTLKNKSRPDCVIFMPPAGPLIIDAKFPLEAMTAFRDAATDDERKQAMARVKQDTARHISDIAEKYLIPGETQDIALMFIPSESLYADLHERFDDLVQRARRARVMIVSPNMAVLAIQLVRQIRKDAEMQEAVETIRSEVILMMKDVGLLGDRVRKLQTHFGQANTDIEAILTSTGKIEKRATKIETLDFESDAQSAQVVPMTRKLEAGE